MKDITVVLSLCVILFITLYIDLKIGKDKQ